MQRVSAFLPSWDRSRSTNVQPTAAGAGAAKAPASAPAHRASRPLALDKVFGWAEKISGPGNRLSLTTTPNGTNVPANAGPTAEGRYHRENYWPTTLDREADKAARILKSFCRKLPCLLL